MLGFALDPAALTIIFPFSMLIFPTLNDPAPPELGSELFGEFFAVLALPPRLE